LIKVKVTINDSFNDGNIFNFTNTRDNIFNNKKFYVNSHVDSPDFWFINENIKNNKFEEVNIDKKNVFFLGSETIYESDYFFTQSKINFLNHFDTIYSPKNIYNDKAKNVPPFLSWSLRGYPFRSNHDESDLEYFRSLEPKKTKLISVYCSNKKITEYQKLRIEFLYKLKDYFDKEIDFYGSAFNNNTIYKLDGLLDYKYHISIENNNYKNIISEKLYDPFLALSFPIYSGANNLDEYFNSKSFEYLDLNDFNGSLSKIESILNNDIYKSRVKYLKYSRKVILDKFNLIKRIDDIVNSKSKDSFESKSRIKIFNKKVYENKSFFAKLAFKVNKKLEIVSKFLKTYYT